MHLKMWRKRWLVLTSQTLSSFKSDAPGEKHTEHIQLASVVAVSTDMNAGRDNVFFIELKTQKFLVATSSPDVTTDWVHEIKSACARLKSKDSSQEKAQTSEISSKLQSLLSVLTEREHWLQADLAQAQSALVAKAHAEVAYIREMHESIEQVFAVFSAVYSDSGLSLQEKLRQLRGLAGATANLNPDLVCETGLRAYVNSDLAQKLVRKCVKMTQVSPIERHLRRTEITRALKWRYNGQRYDALSFTVSKSIELTAVGFCIPHKPNRVTRLLSLKIVPGASVVANQTTVYVHPQVVELLFSPDESVQKVVLSQRISLRAGCSYTLVGQLEGASTYKCVLCQKIMTGEVDWTFATTTFPSMDHSNRTDVDCGPIADFYYVFPCS